MRNEGGRKPEDSKVVLGMAINDITEGLPEMKARLPRSRVQKVSSAYYDWLQCVVTALVISIMVFVFGGRVIGVEMHSMNPTLYEGDKVMMSNLLYRPKQGDVVVLTKRGFSAEPIVKRVIAVGGQTIDIDYETGEVWVDGEVLEEGYIAEETRVGYDVEFPVKVPEGSIFVMGDNRNRSTDSRDSRVGMVDRRCVLGKVYAVVAPIGRIGWITNGR